MYTVLTVIHVIACLFMIGVVLLQQGKGADMGAVFGGSSQTLFGSSGAGNFLTRMTAAMAAVFFVTSLALAYGSASRVTTTIFDDAPLTDTAPVPGGEPAPAPEGGAPAPQGAAPAPEGAAPAPEGAPAPEPQANAAPAPDGAGAAAGIKVEAEQAPAAVADAAQAVEGAAQDAAAKADGAAAAAVGGEAEKAAAP
jgi:preprotein translocase subunit SecG